MIKPDNRGQPVHFDRSLPGVTKGTKPYMFTHMFFGLKKGHPVKTTHVHTHMFFGLERS